VFEHLRHFSGIGADGRYKTRTGARRPGLQWLPHRGCRVGGDGECRCSDLSRYRQPRDTTPERLAGRIIIPHPPMTATQLTVAEMRDIIAYIMSLKRQP
jgi:hypothetical protein